MICTLLQQYGFNVNSLQKKYGGSRAPGFVYGEECTLHKGVGLVSASDCHQMPCPRP